MSGTEQLKFNVDHEQTLHQGFYRMVELTVTHDKFDGGQLTIKREVMDRHDAVVLMLIDLATESLVFIEQFRVGALKEPNPWLIEMVAGLIDKDESPEDVARREASEEAGVGVGRLEKICRYLPSPGGTNECVHLYVGEVDSTKASGVHGLAQEGEDIRVVTVGLEKAFTWLEEGTINNAAGVIGLQWLQLNLESLKQRWQ